MISYLAYGYRVTYSPRSAQLQSYSFLYGPLDKVLIGISYLPVIFVDLDDSEKSEAKPLF